ncbi:MAG: hypothetical protein A2096_16460 [Spirochaetes bacterium GWF1_41_5]|nr:MAG: hypothetical protein A2096_16460 [Spirochaetes bacterium GWF1_41_5]HBE01818.1 hypothetical protein [Spirochaetia bacterium]
MPYPLLFSPLAIKGKTAPNRFVSQPMEANDSDQGKVSERAIMRYKKLAAGKWGIVFVEALSVSASSLARKNGMILNRDNLGGFRRLVGEFKKIDPRALLIFQISHSGNRSGDFSRKTSICPRAEKNTEYLSAGEIEEIRRSFVEAAVLSAKAGADGIDFKMCHGYFGSEMLRPANTRPDIWGGSFENRTRFLKLSVPEIRTMVDNEGFLIGTRISMYEGIRGGTGTSGENEIIEDLAETGKLIRLLESLGLDYLNVSAGIPGITSEITRPVPHGRYLYLHHFRYTRLAKELCSKMKIIGSAYSLLKEEGLALAEENIKKGYADFAGWGRQSLADPLFPQKVSENKKINFCEACSGCTRLMQRQVNIGCILYDQYYSDLHKNK